jgi:DnaK suppressor protein
MRAVPLTQKQTDRLRQLLRRIHEERTTDFDELSEEAAHAVAERTSDRGEVGAAEWSEQMDLELLEGEDRNLQEVAEALRRMEEGTYGLCEECGQPIGYTRLEALPWARACVACQERLEAEQAGERGPRAAGPPG